MRRRGRPFVYLGVATWHQSRNGILGGHGVKLPTKEKGRRMGEGGEFSTDPQKGKKKGGGGKKPGQRLRRGSGMRPCT